jgi:hypothetical protein
MTHFEIAQFVDNVIKQVDGFIVDKVHFDLIVDGNTISFDLPLTKEKVDEYSGRTLKPGVQMTDRGAFFKSGKGGGFVKKEDAYA